MRDAEICGIGGTRKTRRRRADPAVHDDLVQRRFVADGPDRRWCTDITEHPTAEGNLPWSPTPAVADGTSRARRGQAR